MIDLPYSLLIEATTEPDFFGFYAYDLEGFTGVGHSIEDCIYQARHGMKEFIDELNAQKLSVPEPRLRVNIVIQNADE